MNLKRMDTRMLNRRELLFGAAALPAARAAAPGEWRNRQSGLAYRRLGRTNFMISEVVMGGNTIGPDNYEHVLEAADMGLNYLDTAPAYRQGKSEEGYGRVLKARPRDKFFLNTKISLWDLNRNDLYQKIFESLPESEQKKLKAAALDEIARRKADAPDYMVNYFDRQREEMDRSALANVMEKKYGREIDRKKNYRQLIVDSLEESLRRMGTDHVDLLACPHGASNGHELLNYPEIFDAFESLKKAGKVRYLSVSAHSDPAGVLEAAVKAKVYSAAMVAYNIVNHPRVAPALEAARKADLGVIAMKVARPVHHGRNNGKPNDPARVKMVENAVAGPLKPPQKAYVWALRNPNLSAVISEMVNRDMVRDNVPLGKEKA
jgi:aryl-alcohol dehydrogenase-like predicted oxidoreductase